MRKIPVVINGDQNQIVGFLELDATLSDEQIRDMYVSWLWLPERKRVISMSLVPMQSVPSSRDLDPVHCPKCTASVPYGSYHARGTSEFDTYWICEGRHASDPGIIRHR